MAAQVSLNMQTHVFEILMITDTDQGIGYLNAIDCVKLFGSVFSWCYDVLPIVAFQGFCLGCSKVGDTWCGRTTQSYTIITCAGIGTSWHIIKNTSYNNVIVMYIGNLVCLDYVQPTCWLIIWSFLPRSYKSWVKDGLNMCLSKRKAFIPWSGEGVINQQY